MPRERLVLTRQDFLPGLLHRRRLTDLRTARRQERPDVDGTDDVDVPAGQDRPDYPKPRSATEVTTAGAANLLGGGSGTNRRRCGCSGRSGPARISETH